MIDPRDPRDRRLELDEQLREREDDDRRVGEGDRDRERQGDLEARDGRLRERVGHVARSLRAGQRTPGAPPLESTRAVWCLVGCATPETRKGSLWQETRLRARRAGGARRRARGEPSRRRPPVRTRTASSPTGSPTRAGSPRPGAARCSSRSRAPARSRASSRGDGAHASVRTFAEVVRPGAGRSPVEVAYQGPNHVWVTIAGDPAAGGSRVVRLDRKGTDDAVGRHRRLPGRRTRIRTTRTTSPRSRTRSGSPCSAGRRRPRRRLGEQRRPQDRPEAEDHDGRPLPARGRAVARRRAALPGPAARHADARRVRSDGDRDRPRRRVVRVRAEGLPVRQGHVADLADRARRRRTRPAIRSTRAPASARRTRPGSRP